MIPDEKFRNGPEFRAQHYADRCPLLAILRTWPKAVMIDTVPMPHKRGAHMPPPTLNRQTGNAEQFGFVGEIVDDPGAEKMMTPIGKAGC